MVNKLNIVTKRFVKRFLENRGILVKSKLQFSNIEVALARAVKKIIKTQEFQLEAGIEGIVFTKDRPLQLHALLKSYFAFSEHTPKLTVIYNANTEEIDKAYLNISQLFQDKDINFVKEKSFRDALISSIKDVKTDKIFFLVDDIIFVRPVDFEFVTAFCLDGAIFSMRLAPHLKYCYTSAENQKLPRLSQEGCNLKKELVYSWNWGQGDLDWGYPLSLDGNVFPTSYIATLSQLVDYTAPNSFETALQIFQSLYIDYKGICYESSRLINIPFNKVQTENNNISGNISATEMFQLWLKGKEIDISCYADLLNVSAHQEMELFLKERL